MQFKNKNSESRRYLETYLRLTFDKPCFLQERLFPFVNSF